MNNQSFVSKLEHEVSLNFLPHLLSIKLVNQPLAIEYPHRGDALNLDKCVRSKLMVILSPGLLITRKETVNRKTRALSILYKLVVVGHNFLAARAPVFSILSLVARKQHNAPLLLLYQKI